MLGMGGGACVVLWEGAIVWEGACVVLWEGARVVLWEGAIVWGGGGELVLCCGKEL